jgi:hypothetical protein
LSIPTYECLVFVRCEFVVDMIEEPVPAAGRFRVTARSLSRTLPHDNWEQTDEFAGVVTRYGTLGPIVIDLDDGPDAGRELLLESAVTASFARA